MEYSFRVPNDALKYEHFQISWLKDRWYVILLEKNIWSGIWYNKFQEI